MGKLNNVTLFATGLFFVTWVLASLGIGQVQEAPIDVECNDLSEVIKKPEDLNAEDKQHILAKLMGSASSSSSGSAASSVQATTPAPADPAKNKYMEESIKHFPCGDEYSYDGALESRIDDFVKPSGSKYPCQYLGCGRKDYIAVTSKCKKESGTSDVDADMGNVELKCTGSSSHADMKTATFAISMISSLVAIGLFIFGCKQGAEGGAGAAAKAHTVTVGPKADTFGSDTPVQPFVPA